MDININKNRGITLIEVLVSIALFSVVILLIGLFTRNIFYYNSVFSGGLSSYDQLKKVLYPIASEIRSASPSSLGSYPIETAENNNFVFFADINGDGLKERVRYFLSNKTLKKGVIIPSGVPLSYQSSNEIVTDIVNNVVNGTVPVFNYYDTNYNGSNSSLSSPIDILSVRLVKITIISDTDPNRPPAPITITTQASMRNLKDNL